MSDRQKVLVALIASILLHAVIFFSVGLSGMLHGNSDQKPLEKLKLVSVAVATPTPIPFQFTPLQARATPTPMIDSDDLHETDKAPKKPLFESDKNLAAGSMQPAKGNVPLPSQDGKDRKELAFSTHKYLLGKGEGSTSVPPVMEMAAAPDLPKPRTESTPLPPRPTPVPTPPPPTPEPTAMPTPKVEQKVAAVTPAPTPTPVAAEEPFFRPTPVPTLVAAPTPDIAHPTPVPVAPTPKPVENVAMMATPRPLTPPERVQPQQQPQQPQQPASLPETQQNQIEGSISNRDRPGVEAVGTPLGRYRKRISDAIRGGWYNYVEQRRDLITSGSVRIRFSINPNGQVENLKVVSNDSNNEALESCSVQAIYNAKFLPPPQEIAPSLENGRYEETFTFTVYPYQ